MARRAAKRVATPVEAAAIEKLARAMEPEAWAEYGAGDGVCTNDAGWKCMDSVKTAQRLIRVFPAIVQAVG